MWQEDRKKVDRKTQKFIPLTDAVIENLIALPLQFAPAQRGRQDMKRYMEAGLEEPPAR